MDAQTKTVMDENWEKRLRIAEALKHDPKRSDRIIASETRTSQPSVFRVRRDLEKAGIIPVIAHHERRWQPPGSRKEYVAKMKAQIKAELKKDPARSDRLIASIINTNHSTVRVMRKALESLGEIPRIVPSKTVNVAGLTGLNTDGGARVTVPEGISLTQYVNEGMVLAKANNLSLQRIARHLGISVRSYSIVKATIELSRRPDLSKGDMDTVRLALAKMDEERRVLVFWNLIAPITKMVFGSYEKKGKTRFVLNNRNEVRRKQLFQHGLGLITDTCARALEIEIPHLPEGEILDAAGKLTKAIESLKQLRGKIRRHR